MQTSESINELSAALAVAQGHMTGAKKDSTNPHFKSSYADLASVWDACRKAITDAGLSIIQAPRGILTSAGGWAVEVETRLLHKSGQWVSDTLTVPVGKADAQGVGSAVTYARRYALAAFVGVAPEDDDGNAASVGTTHHREYVDTRSGEISDAPLKANGSVLTVTRVEDQPTKKQGTTRYTIHFSNGLKATTINDRLAQLARDLEASGEAVLPPVTKKTPYGTDLVEIHRKSAATVTSDPYDGPELTDADIPF